MFTVQVATSVPDGGDTIKDPSRDEADLSGETLLYRAVIEACGE